TLYTAAHRCPVWASGGPEFNWSISNTSSRLRFNQAQRMRAGINNTQQSSWPAGYGEQMRTDSQECGLGLQHRDCVEQHRTASLVAQPRVQIRQEPADPFYSKGDR